MNRPCPKHAVDCAGRLLTRSRETMLALCAAMVVAQASAAPAPWPVRPIVVTVIGMPGSAPDKIARELGERIGVSLGQPVVIENSGAGGGIVGMDQARRAPPDGYHFVLSHIAAVAVNPSLFKSLPYDTVRDFEPVSLLVSGPFVLVATPGLGVSSFAQLVDRAKAKPGTLFYGSTGIATPSNIFFEQLKSAASISIDHVAFKGPPALLQALRSEQVPVGMESYATLQPLLAAGKARALAVSGDARLRPLPDTPTFRELGIPDIGVSWIAMLAPKGTPVPIVASMQRALADALGATDIRLSYEALGRRIIAGTPDELAAYIRVELSRWQAVIRDARITIE
jgi:tripartite-type tricarboxylate transporter receptor subunit TctC